MSKHHWQQKLQRMGFDTKKAMVMAALLAVGLLLWGRLLLKEVPRTASAGAADTVAVAAGSGGLSASAAAHRQQVRVRLPDRVKRDLFSFDHKPYRRTVVPSQDDTGPNPGSREADEASRLAAVQQAAARLTLNSVMMGGSPHAWINGVAMAPGDEIEGFTLIRVSDRNVLLKKDGFVIRLKM